MRKCLGLILRGNNCLIFVILGFMELHKKNIQKWNFLIKHTVVQGNTIANKAETMLGSG